MPMIDIKGMMNGIDRVNHLKNIPLYMEIRVLFFKFDVTGFAVIIYSKV